MFCRRYECASFVIRSMKFLDLFNTSVAVKELVFELKIYSQNESQSLNNNICTVGGEYVIAGVCFISKNYYPALLAVLYTEKIIQSTDISVKFCYILTFITFLAFRVTCASGAGLPILN